MTAAAPHCRAQRRALATLAAPGRNGVTQALLSELGLSCGVNGAI